MKLKALRKEIDFILLQGGLDALDTGILDIAYDSRDVLRGSMFVCIRGHSVDGHQYISAAIEKGAVAIVIEDSTAGSHEREVGKGNGNADKRNKTEAVESNGSVQQILTSIPDNVAVISVASTRYALALMSAAFFAYPARKLTTIALTGTKGKTTTACMIKSILEAANRRAGLIGTMGIMIDDELALSPNTTPESYELHKALAKMVAAECDYAIVEVSSQGLKLNRTAGIFFDYGIFTNLSPDHIGPAEHESMEEYVACKSLLFRQCKSGIINFDDKHLDQILKNHTCAVKGFSANVTNIKTEAASANTSTMPRSESLGLETFGSNSTDLFSPAKLSRIANSSPSAVGTADLSALNIGLLKEKGNLGVEFDTRGRLSCHAKLSMPGRFSVYNALAAMLVCHEEGVFQRCILKGLEKFQIKGRVEMLPVPGDYTVIIDFAHNEVSTRSILETLLEYKPKRLICVYGCGGERSKQRRYAMGEVTGELADLCVLTADNPRSESICDINNDIKVGLAKTACPYVEIDDRREAIAFCIKNAQPEDMIVLLGKGHENYQDIDGIKYPFDEREAVAEAISSAAQK